MNRITWTADGYGNLRGAVRGMDLFTIDRSSFRSGPKYILRNRLNFSAVDIDIKGDDEEVLKGNAERLLAAYVAALGAVFPDALDQPQEPTP